LANFLRRVAAKSLQSVPHFELRWQAQRDTALERTRRVEISTPIVRPKAPSPLPLCRRSSRRLHPLKRPEGRAPVTASAGRFHPAGAAGSGRKLHLFLRNSAQAFTASDALKVGINILEVTEFLSLCGTWLSISLIHMTSAMTESNAVDQLLFQ
jgi:hypothetical protein